MNYNEYREKIEEKLNGKTYIEYKKKYEKLQIEKNILNDMIKSKDIIFEEANKLKKEYDKLMVDYVTTTKKVNEQRDKIIGMIL